MANAIYLFVWNGGGGVFMGNYMHVFQILGTSYEIKEFLSLGTST